MVFRLPCASDASIFPLPFVSCARTFCGSGVSAGGIAMFFQHVLVADEPRRVMA